MIRFVPRCIVRPAFWEMIRTFSNYYKRGVPFAPIESSRFPHIVTSPALDRFCVSSFGPASEEYVKNGKTELRRDSDLYILPKQRVR